MSCCQSNPQLPRRRTRHRQLPARLRPASYLPPPKYVFEGLRAVAAGHGVAWPSLAVAAGLAVLDILLAYLCFTRVYRYAVRTGLVAHYPRTGELHRFSFTGRWGAWGRHRSRYSETCAGAAAGGSSTQVSEYRNLWHPVVASDS